MSAIVEEGVPQKWRDVLSLLRTRLALDAGFGDGAALLISDLWGARSSFAVRCVRQGVVSERLNAPEELPKEILHWGEQPPEEYEAEVEAYWNNIVGVGYDQAEYWSLVRQCTENTEGSEPSNR